MVSAPMAVTLIRFGHTSTREQGHACSDRPRHGRRRFQRSGLGAVIPRRRGEPEGSCRLGSRPCGRQPLGGILEGGHEPGVHPVELLPRHLGRRMDERGRGSRELRGPHRFQRIRGGSLQVPGTYRRSRPEKVARAVLASRVLATLQAATTGSPFFQGIGLRPQPWAGISRPVGPDAEGTQLLVTSPMVD